jgi:energy-coupling factor transporter ATP-binding protein EcfA2
VRGPLMLPLPVPIETPRTLLELLGDEWGYSEDDAILAAAAIVMMFEPIGTLPVVVVTGEQGSGKSTFCKLLRITVDPSGVPMGSPPREIRDLHVQARTTYAIAFDNLNFLARDLSDAIASLATGGGQRARQLYTDSEEVAARFRRPALLNGLSSPATMADLLDRALMFELPARTETTKESEHELERRIGAAGDELFAAAVVAVKGGLRNLKTTPVARWHRLTDGATLAIAAASAIGTSKEKMEQALRANRESIDSLVISGDDFITAVVEWATQGEWTGTTGELLELLPEKTKAGKRGHLRKSWPSTPAVAGRQLREKAPVLRRAGIEWEEQSRASSRQYRLSVRAPVKGSYLPSLPSLPSRDGQEPLEQAISELDGKTTDEEVAVVLLSGPEDAQKGLNQAISEEPLDSTTATTAKSPPLRAGEDPRSVDPDGDAIVAEADAS